MDKTLQTIVNSYLDQYESWDESINCYILNQSKRAESEEEAIKQISSVVAILAELANSSARYGRFKDNFEYDKFRQNYYGPELIINSEKTETTYYIGLDNNGLYIRTYLKHSFSLKNMDDKFWLSFLSLYNYGKFELIENEYFGKSIRSKYPELFNNQKGIVFRIFRKYFVSFLAEEDINFREEVIGSLGDLQVTWDSSFGFEKIVEECCLVFKVFYKLNYDLWKIEDVKSKSKK